MCSLIFCAWSLRRVMVVSLFQAVWALGNIAGDNAECRDYVLNCGILPSLKQWVCVCVCFTNVLMLATWWDWARCRYWSRLLPISRLLAKSNRLTTTRNAVWALSNLCRGKNPPPEFAKVSPVALMFFVQGFRHCLRLFCNRQEFNGCLMVVHSQNSLILIS